MQGTTQTDESGRSLGTLLRDLTHNVSDLVRSELALARAETSEKVSQAGTAIASIAAGAALGLAALIIVLQALVIALSNIMEPWLASALVGLAVAALAWFLIKKGQDDLKVSNLTPERTIDNVRKDARMAADHVQPDHAGRTSNPSVHPINPSAGVKRSDVEQEARR
jgi:uncharacterized membrane protein YqjE